MSLQLEHRYFADMYGRLKEAQDRVVGGQDVDLDHMLNLQRKR